MKRKINWPDNGITAWKSDDKEFMKTRKDEWAKVKQVLTLLKTYISRSLHSQHRELYLTGDIVKTYKPDKYLYGYSLSYNDVTLLFQVWYYPENNLDYFHILFDKADKGDIEASRSSFNEYYRAIGNSEFDPQYGLMGGREESVFRTLYPSKNPEEIRAQKNPSDLMLGPDIRLICSHMISAYNPRFCGAIGNVNHHGQYIWDYLEYQLENHPNEASKITGFFYKMLHTAKYREKTQPKFPLDKPDVIALADNLCRRFENREFSPGLMSLWDNIDDLYQDKYVNARE
ncbi:MAG: hypothetical protein QNJ69_08735 [Gammaproteobacteria bacterium]|nr:hypothetical protein [Gammaproteobacteria bacterium]